MVYNSFKIINEDCMYSFLTEGELRHTETGERFVFNVREEHAYNQKRYEALGEVGACQHVFASLFV